MFMAFTLWAVFGELDIVVSAQGKLVPATFVRVSQPVEAGSVVELLVHDGQTVKAGELLARLDSAASRADADSLQAERALLQARLSFNPDLMKVQPR
jgi:HlyD family secretion protein